MSIILTAILASLIVLSSIAVLVTRDNLYASIYLAIASALTACLYFVYGTGLMFALIVLIYIGVVVGLTILIAATYRYVEVRSISVNKYWLPPLIIAIALTIATAFRHMQLVKIPTTAQLSLNTLSTFASDYAVYIALLALLLLVIAIGCIKIAREVFR